MRELDLSLIKFEGLSRDLGRSQIDGDPLAVAYEIRAVLDEHISQLEADATFTARRRGAVRELAARAAVDAARKSRPLSQEEAQRLTLEAIEQAKSGLPPMQP